MIGLVVDEVARLGVVYQPTTGTLWCGARGIGAFRVDADGSERPIRVSAVTRPEAAKVTVSRSRRSDPLKRALDRIHARQVIPMGSAGLKGALVAESIADAYLAVGTSGKYWDACAMDAIVSAAAVIASQYFAHTPPILGPDGAPVPGSIAVLEKVDLNGSNQWISIRGQDVNKPILLFLAGGPGGSQLVTERRSLAGLEQHFVVVNWEQPGAGKSFDALDRAIRGENPVSARN